MGSRYDGAILAAVDEYWAERCRPPTLREIMGLTGITSTATARHAVRGLVRRGELLHRGDGRGSSRGLVPLWVARAVGEAAEDRATEP